MYVLLIFFCTEFKAGPIPKYFDTVETELEVASKLELPDSDEEDEKSNDVDEQPEPEFSRRARARLASGACAQDVSAADLICAAKMAAKLPQDRPKAAKQRRQKFSRKSVKQELAEASQALGSSRHSLGRESSRRSFDRSQSTASDLSIPRGFFRLDSGLASSSSSSDHSMSLEHEGPPVEEERPYMVVETPFLKLLSECVEKNDLAEVEMKYPEYLSTFISYLPSADEVSSGDEEANERYSDPVVAREVSMSIMEKLADYIRQRPGEAAWKRPRGIRFVYETKERKVQELKAAEKRRKEQLLRCRRIVSGTESFGRDKMSALLAGKDDGAKAVRAEVDSLHPNDNKKQPLKSCLRKGPLKTPQGDQARTSWEAAYRELLPAAGHKPESILRKSSSEDKPFDAAKKPLKSCLRVTSYDCRGGPGRPAYRKIRRVSSHKTVSFDESTLKKGDKGEKQEEEEAGPWGLRRCFKFSKPRQARPDKPALQRQRTVSASENTPEDPALEEPPAEVQTDIKLDWILNSTDTTAKPKEGAAKTKSPTPKESSTLKPAAITTAEGSSTSSSSEKATSEAQPTANQEQICAGSDVSRAAAAASASDATQAPAEQGSIDPQALSHIASGKDSAATTEATGFRAAKLSKLRVRLNPKDQAEGDDGAANRDRSPAVRFELFVSS